MLLRSEQYYVLFRRIVTTSERVESYAGVEYDDTHVTRARFWCLLGGEIQRSGIDGSDFWYVFHSMLCLDNDVFRVCQ